MKILVTKKKDDPMALRISIGGFKEAGENAYITYRGDLEEVQKLLTIVAEQFQKLQVEPEVSPNDGKQYA